MSEDANVALEATEEAAAPTSNGHRGRPRPQATIQRDDAVKAALAEGPLTRKQLAEKLGWESKDVYASLWRFRHYDKQVEKLEGKSEWSLTAS